MSKTICLNMIVTGDDFIGLRESLISIKDCIDYWVIADLQMSDQAEQLIEEILADVEGEIVATDSIDKTDSRNALIRYSVDKADYLLMLDSNTRISVDKGSEGWRESLDADGYLILSQGSPRCAELRLIKSESGWRYHGVTSEFLVSSASASSQFLAGLSTQKLVDPTAENKKNSEHRALLETHVLANTEDGHALFHLAKLLMIEGNHQGALDAFERYLNVPQKWDQEWHWYALYHQAKLLELLKFELVEVIAAYEDAYQFRPRRAEPLYELARLFRENDQFAKAHLYAHQAFAIALPEREAYDLDLNVYHWLIPNEYAIACQKMGHQEDAIIATNKAIHYSHRNKNFVRSLVASRDRSLAVLRDAKKQPLKKRKDVKNRFRVVLPYRNAGAWLEDAARSLLNQDYPNFTATFIDDCSTDNSNSYIPTDDSRINLIVNTERLGPMVNRMNFINSCEPSDIVLYLDGDDQLASDDVLSYLNDVYNQRDCWLTYGQYLSQHGNLGYAQPYPTQKSLVEELETGNQRFPMHPITHRAALFHKLRDFDPTLSCFKDDNDDWLFYASDAVLARPLFYMAGYEKVHYCSRVLYLYTEGHEISESIHNKRDQIEACRLSNKRLRPPTLANLLF